MSENYMRFWGVRGSYASPQTDKLGVGGNTSCVEIRAGNHLLICDGGTGIIPLGDLLISESPTPETLIVFTHYHWDHICGLPFFQPAFSAEWKIRFFGPGQNVGDIEQRLSNQMKSPYFPIEIGSWAADIEYVKPIEGKIPHGPFDVSYHNVHHPGTTYGYRVEIAGKVIIYMPDNEIDFLRSSIAQRTDEFTEEEHQMIARIQREERDVELSGVRRADILIHDAQYTPEDYSKKRGWGHSCYVDVVNFAIDAEIKVLYLYHHDPGHNDVQIATIHQECLALVAERGSSLQIHVAREGAKIPL